MPTFNEIVAKLKDLKTQGYIKTHRSGPTGIGKTLEDLLEIKENNIPDPDIEGTIELKSARKNATSMITLFTKSPIPQKSNTFLLKKFGYITSESKNKKILHTTLNGVNFNKLRGEIGFKVIFEDNKLKITSNKTMEMEVYWDEVTLKKNFEKKLPKLFYVKADSRGSGKNEEFWFNEAYLLSGFDYQNFVKLIKSGDILVDIRIGQYPDGSSHDHGTGFRVLPNKLDLCFKNRVSYL